MPQPQHLPLLLAAVIAFSLLVLACGDGVDDSSTSTGGVLIETRTPASTGESSATSHVSAAGTTAAPDSSDAAPTEVPPTPTQPPPTATEAPPPPTATPLPLEPVVFSPPQMVQGGAVVVYFNEPASAATLTFGGNQYPMLSNGAGWWAMIGIGAFAQPGVAPVTIAYNPPNSTETLSMADSLEIVARDFPVENINLDPQTSSLLQPDIVNNELAIRAAVFSGYTTQRLWSGAFVAPADGSITSIYGQARSYNGGPVSSYHHGTDFGGPTGTPVRAAAAGRVVFAQELQVRGNTIIIDHGAGVMTAYNHLSAFAVAEGQEVAAGQYIGDIGSTGLVTGPHLHWEVVIRGIEVDGALWLQGQYIGP